ncbi:hypothetical protein [Arthrobacter sp. StoSoilB20]|uniref:hypothetical protein n=1 Tax=Arthrobacter sp. StoSoilB20 TaxID=2830995 RepID=UPI001CC4BDA5|nr:hypothetical protein [Arthrobacter sp. StoSoilB20]BCW60963.1 hypothetical protein StoSoilB20_43100 [Arthrobacter sp. StoSoilB20]
MTWRSITVGMVFAVAVPLLAACDPAGPGSGGSSSSGPGPGGSSTDGSSAETTGTNHGPITVEVNQSRDQYGKQAILLQLTNTTDLPLTVTRAQLRSTLFNGDISWEPSAGSLELPPHQPKSLPAVLPAATCEASESTSAELRAQVTYSAPDKASVEEDTSASDPFGVLSRNAGELCLASEAAAVAGIVLDPELEVAADGRTAVVRLVITPTAPSTAGKGAERITIESIDETTLLAQSPEAPWPVNVTVGGAPQEIPLTIRPARCDPHAVAEDKVGTLLPLRVTVGDRKGVLKIPASNDLRGRIYDFVTAACVPAG